MKQRDKGKIQIGEHEIESENSRGFRGGSARSGNGICRGVQEVYLFGISIRVSPVKAGVKSIFESSFAGNRKIRTEDRRLTIVKRQSEVSNDDLFN
uniref:Uncharacterized protein n=1 Tax=Leptospira ellisii TaxID=2023197 RepID=A0A2N0B3W1_9LEPT|nr:hypothetical protein CH379_19860 [Leptospira ellisii]